MKKVFFMFMMLVTTISFANDPPLYSFGNDDQMKVTINNDADVYVATINLLTAKVVQSKDSFAETHAFKINKSDRDFFIVVNTKTKGCHYRYCTDLFSHIDPGRNYAIKTLTFKPFELKSKRYGSSSGNHRN